MTTNFFSPLSFVAVFAFWIRDPGWIKIRIRDKHLGSATLPHVLSFLPSRLIIERDAEYRIDPYPDPE
jgi:hypothetical protein